ncbi:MAG: hypothetical protein ACI3ZC_06610 [Candidatus Cryptobacteroides sp.]
MRTKRYLIFILAFYAVCGCCRDESVNSDGNRIPVSFSFVETGRTRSSIDLDEDAVNDINIICYRDGLLDCNLFSDGGETVEMLLDEDQYEVYAIANLGTEFPAPETEIGMKEWRYSVSSSSELGPSTLFTASKKISVSVPGTHEVMDLTRLITKCGFRFDASALPGMKVTSARICQAALDAAPFAEGHSIPERIESSGDYASESDLAILNSGGTVYFYSLENAQGRLLEDNDDPWSKVPEKIPGKAGQCTYIEVSTSFSGSPDGYVGDVLYRFYLGQDTCRDFSIYRNTECIVTMTASKDGLEKIGWLIDTSGLGHDPLFNFHMPQMPEYVGQWSEINLPYITESTPVTVCYGDRSLVLGDKTGPAIDTVEMPNGLTLLYARDVSLQRLFIYSSTRTPAAGNRYSDFTLSSSERTVSINSASSAWPEYALRDAVSGSLITDADLNEDGHKTVDFLLYLTDRTGSILAPSSFAIPDSGLASAAGFHTSGNEEGDVMGLFIHDLIEPAVSGEFTGSGISGTVDENAPAGCAISVPSDHGELLLSEHAASGTIYGISEGTATLGIGIESDTEGLFGILYKVNCNIRKAFPGQRYLGNITNGQLLMSALAADQHVENHVLNIYDGEEGTEAAEWTFTRVPASGGTLPDSQLYAQSLSGHNSLSIKSVNNGKMTIQLVPPSADTGSNDYRPFFASGAFCFMGSVTNPFTGQTFTGYYLQDIILEFSIIAQIDFIPGYIGFYFVPCNVAFASYKYSYSWSHNLPLVIKPETLVSSSVTLDESNRINCQIAGDKPAGLVPVPKEQISRKGELEYKIHMYENNYQENNKFPFSESYADEAMTMLWGNLTPDDDPDKAGIDVQQCLKFSIIPLNKNGTMMTGVDELKIDRSNYASYPAFEGFYHITKEYSGKYTGSILDRIGYYVIEASGNARRLSTPFYSDAL